MFDISCAFRSDYRENNWYYNAGDYSALVLKNHSFLAHVVNNRFGTAAHKAECLYFKYCKDWRTSLEAIHLLINHRHYLDAKSPIKEFDENNILNYNYTFGEMCREILDSIKIL